jgi:hypothetical protein
MVIHILAAIISLKGKFWSMVNPFGLTDDVPSFKFVCFLMPFALKTWLTWIQITMQASSGKKGRS